MYSAWEVPFQYSDEKLGVFGCYAESKYTILPRWYVALRYGVLDFGKADLGGLQQQWDYDVTEWEGGIGYFVERNVVMKLVRRETRTRGGSHPKDNLTAFQLAVSF